MIISKLQAPVSAFVYWATVVLVLSSELGVLAIIREILLSLMAADHSRSNRRQIYNEQSLNGKLWLHFIKRFAKTNCKLFTPFFSFYIVEITAFILLSFFAVVQALMKHYTLFLSGVFFFHVVVCVFFLRTKYPDGFRGSPKYEKMHTSKRS